MYKMKDSVEDWEIQAEESKVGWINTGLSFGKNLVLTGVLISSVPIVLPPLVVISSIGFACSVPFGVAFASYTCTEKIMSKLLPYQMLDEEIVINTCEKEEYEQESIYVIRDEPINIVMNEGLIDVGECVEESQDDLKIVEIEQSVLKPMTEGDIMRMEESKDNLEIVEIEQSVLEPMTEGDIVRMEESQDNLEIAEIEQSELEPIIEGDIVRMGPDNKIVTDERDMKLEEIENESRCSSTTAGDSTLKSSTDHDKKCVETMEGIMEEKNSKLKKINRREKDKKGQTVSRKQTGKKRKVLLRVEEDQLLEETKTDNLDFDVDVKGKIGQVMEDLSSRVIVEDKIAEEDTCKIVCIDSGNQINKLEDDANVFENEPHFECSFEEPQSVVLIGGTISDEENSTIMPSTETNEENPNQDESIHELKCDEITNLKEGDTHEIDLLHHKAPLDDGNIWKKIDEEKIWKQIDAIRLIVGLKAPRHSSYFEELKVLYLFTGIDTSKLVTDKSDLTEFYNKLQFLMSVIGVK